MTDQRRIPLWAVALAAAVVLTGVIGLILLLGNDDQPDAQPTEPTASQTPDATEPTAPDETTTPTVSGEEWTSVDVAGITLPVSEQAGPHDLSDGRAQDFEQTELGAVMAAVHLVPRLSGFATPAVFEPTIEEQVVAGENAQRLLTAAQTEYAAAVDAQGRDDPRAAGTVRGYRVLSYSDAAATVELWTEAQGPDGTVRIASEVDLIWDGQWKVQAPPDGDWATVAGELPDTTSFTEFPEGVR
ncbi:hypothetical protein [Salsipaludibacter albus]|uniref:hypothetical protein n=1 Tax=Salsipaludibacter albus TaxID=2849650 RepID=UPI001EE41267|nr:hypothetical protein [Salsipaludibacter albus]MBY5163163.1 hypothetical protein [Salsipaludibacter albus]